MLIDKLQKYCCKKDFERFYQLTKW